ncbi:hypothetical protein ACSBR2_035773 [Camellia fascicularis]
MKLVSWNVRGIGKPEKMGRIKKLLKDRHIDVAFFQETKKVVASSTVVRGLWGNRNMEFLFVDPEGSVEGLLCIWDPGVFQLAASCYNRRFILLSDHCPLLLMEDKRDWGPKPFRFINAWTLHPSFSHLFTTCWKNSNFVAWAGSIIRQKLKHLKLELKKWNSEVFGNVSSKLKATEDELHALDITAKARDLLVSEKDRRREVRSEVWKLYRRVEWLWHQKPILNWSL